MPSWDESRGLHGAAASLLLRDIRKYELKPARLDVLDTI